MEVVTIEELEAQLTAVSDPLERRRLRGKIRRLRRRQGLGDTVSVARVRSPRNRNPYADETWQESLHRLRLQAEDLGLPEHVEPMDPPNTTWMGYTRTNDLQTCAEAFIATYGTAPTYWWPMYLTTTPDSPLEYRDVVLMLGPAPS